MLSVSEIAAIVEGCLLHEAPDEVVRVVHDSRNVRSGDLFIALKGERTDGHLHLGEAFSAGASAAIVSQPDRVPVGCRNAIVVDDCLRALWTLARIWRDRLESRFVGITGSCGKTTTKSLIGHLLGEDSCAYVAPESYNTEIGLPLALLNMPSTARIGVFELGANAPGDIVSLAELLRADVAVLTTVGRVHLEGFGSVDEVTREKWELAKSLPDDGIAIVNADCPLLASLATSYQGKLMLYGAKSGEFRGKVKTTPRGIAVQTENPAMKLSSRLMGKHNATNLLAATACALELGVPAKTIEERVTTFEPVPHRMNLVKTEWGYLLDDTYNANPESMAAALRALAELDLPVQRRSFVFGDMLELGDEALAYHREVLDLALGLGVAPIFPVGELANEAALGVTSGRAEEEIVFCDREELREVIARAVVDVETVLLVKGSRGMRLEELVEELAR